MNDTRNFSAVRHSNSIFLKLYKTQITYIHTFELRSKFQEMKENPEYKKKSIELDFKNVPVLVI